MLQVLVDADNLHRVRLAALLLALPADAVITAAGSPQVLGAVSWPAGTTLLPRTGWQRADLELADAYELDDGPLMLATGDGDFAHLGRRHAGPVLAVSDAPCTCRRWGRCWTRSMTVPTPSGLGFAAHRASSAHRTIDLSFRRVQCARTTEML